MPQRLGVDSYSLRFQGWDAFQLCDYAAGLGLDNVHLSERRNLASLDPAYLRELRAHAGRLGLSLEIGMNSFDRFAASFRAELGSGEQQLGEMIEAAAVIGSPIVRCYLGEQRDRRGPVPFEEHLAECRRVLEAVAPRARDRGVRIAVENHGGVDLLGRELRWLIEAVGTDAIGACLDTGNPAYGGEDPLLSTELLAEYAVSTHARDTAVWQSEDGAWAQWTVMGEGNVDLPSILRLLAERAPDCPIDLEVITGGNPASVAYLGADGEFWKSYPTMLARDFARFVALAQDGTRRGLGPRRQVVAPRGATDPPPEIVEQQRRDFEKSVEHAKRVLGLGVKG
ncbi:MAG TPA: sugar phosphate isomerase/epimerase family protein [Chloroflexota bacterium]|jgi:sugar phosphate isomerase/epimerase